MKNYPLKMTTERAVCLRITSIYLQIEDPSTNLFSKLSIYYISFSNETIKNDSKLEFSFPL